jgi:hypothetical protein
MPYNGVINRNLFLPDPIADKNLDDNKSILMTAQFNKLHIQNPHQSFVV